jgi:hypothetical protein
MKAYTPRTLRSLLKKPLIVALGLLLLLVVGAFIYFRSIEVYSVQVTNITPTSATIVWTTRVPTVGGAVVKKGTGDAPWGVFEAYIESIFKRGLAADTRDLEEVAPGDYQRVSSIPRYTHHVTLTNLEPDEAYVYRPFHWWGVAKSSELYTFKTPPDNEVISEPMPVYGNVDFDSDVSPDDVVLVVRVVERNSLDLDKGKSQFVSSPMNEGSYVIDVGNLYKDSLDEPFPRLLDNLSDYTLSILVLTKDGQFPYEVSGTNFQPVDTIIMSEQERSQAPESPFVSQVYAKCDSHCVGDCQGCNDNTAGDPLCITYGCGYMSYCCGTGSCDGHCSNGTQDCDETGVDCGGGGCATCGGGAPETSGPCAGGCTKYDGGSCQPINSASGTCECSVNGRKDGDETGIDCGGAYCPGCDNAGSHCFDRIRNQGEGGVDCGGECAASCAAANTAAQPVGQSCGSAVEGQVFTCADRPDWDCWCQNGRVTTYHAKESAVVTTSQRSAVSRETLLRYPVNSKFGVHTGWGPGADYDHLVAAGNVGYVMNVITGPEQLQALIAEYQKLPTGVVPIVRFCHAEQSDSCPFTDTAVAEKFSESLAKALGKPVAFISGPNEPLQEPWTVKAGYSKCAGKSGNDLVACSTAQWMNDFVARTSDTSNIIKLSPDFNTTEAAFESFVAQMKASGANFGALDGIAGNAYEGAGGKTIAGVIQELKDMGFNEIYITEAGVDPNLQSSDPANYQKLLDALNEVSDDPYLKSLLLFNPVAGLSQDPTFDKHEFTQEQYEALAASLADSASTQTQSDAPGYVVAPTPGTTAGGGGYSCSNGTKSVQGNTTCCNGDFLSVCSDGQKVYIHNRDSGIAGDVFVDWNASGSPEVANIMGGEYWTNDNARSACMHIHTRGDPSQPEHPGICISGGGGQVGVGGGQGRLPLSGFEIKKVHAAESDVQPGVYTVTGGNVDVTTKSIDVVSPGVISYYYDLNENGTFDEGETYLTDEEAQDLQVTFDKHLDVLTYQVTEGWNSLSFPISMTDSSTAFIRTAADLITYLEVVGLTATHVAVYRDQQFVFYSQRIDENNQIQSYGDNFGILPGEAYFVKLYDSGQFSVAGYGVTSSIPVNLGAGWNFVGLFDGQSEYVQALDLLDTMQSDNIPADMLIRWENSRYEGVVLQNDKEYGYDFNVYPIGGYWVRVGTTGGFTESIFSP